MNTRKGTERVRGEKPKRERKRNTRDILQDVHIGVWLLQLRQF